MRWPTIDPGEFRHRITIQQATETRASDGSDVKTWSTFEASVPAKLATTGGREYNAARAVTAELTHLWQIRWRKGVTPKMRVLYYDPNEGTNHYMDIRAVVSPTGIPVYLDLHCVEVIGREPQS